MGFRRRSTIGTVMLSLAYLKRLPVSS